MSFVEDYNEFFNVTWHTDSSGNKISIKRTNEQHKVVGNVVLLNEIPDQFNRVKITNMYELNKGNKINNTNEYIVDYLTGRITFHESKDGSTITIDEYYGRGLIESFAIRTLLLDKNNNWESTNIEDLAQEIKQYIEQNRSEVNSSISNLQNQITTNKNDIEDKYTKHKDGVADKHNAEDVIYSGDVTGQTNVKSAIDNLQNKIGVLSNLTTTEKTNLSGAISEVKDELTQHKLDYASQRQQDQLKVAKVEKDINDYKQVMSQVNVNQEAKQKVTGYGIISLPKNAANGQVGVSVEGETLTNLVDNGVDNSNWLGRGVVGKDGVTINATGDAYIRNIKLKPNTKYTIMLDVISKEGNADIRMSNNFTGAHWIVTSNIGKTKKTFTTKSDLTSTTLILFCSNVAEGNIKFNNVMILEGDYTDRDINYIEGTKSTISASRLKSVGKNLCKDNVYNKRTKWCKIKVNPFENYVLSFNGKLCNATNARPLLRFFNNGIEITSGISSLLSTSIGSTYYYNEGWLIGGDIGQNIFNNMLTYIKGINADEIWVGLSHGDIVANSYITNVQLEKGNTATEYEPYKESTAYVVAKKDNKIVNLKRINDGIYDELDLDNRELVKRTGDLVLDGTENWQDRGLLDNGLRRFSLNSKITYKSSSSNVIEIYCDTLPVQPSVEGYDIVRDRGICIYRQNGNLIYLTLNDGETPQTILSENPATLTYQLAEPEIIPVEVSGNIVSNPSGTIYIEPAVADANVYNDGIIIFEQELNIDYIDKIAKVDYVTGVETPLDISKAVIAEDKKSFTHPDLMNGDMVFFEYFYSNESTQGEATVEYYDSRYVIPDKTLPDKYYKWDIEVDNGVPNVTVTEV